MFVGRNDELQILSKTLQFKSSSVMIYGKRKVGKTTLIKKALESSNDTTIYYECLKAPIQDNIDNFVQLLTKLNILSYSISFKSFIDLFSYLNSLPKTFNIIIDEYPYLKFFEKAETIDSIFQSIIDNYITNIRLYISGSHIGMMKDMLEEKNALYGRFNTIINLKELDYIHASEFYPCKSIYDKIGFYSVFGGSPYINNAINKNKSLKENIIETLLNPTSYVYGYVEHLLISDYTNSINAERIFHTISNGHKKYSDIEDKLGLKTNGNLSKQIKILEDMEIVSKVFPINKMNDKKKLYYEVKDNILRFYYTYIYINKSILQMIGPNAFYEEYIENSINTFISHRFKEIVRTYFSLSVKQGLMKGISNIGTYYYNDSIKKINGEFDVTVERNNNYDIYEDKYYKNPLSEKEMKYEESQIKEIKGLSINRIGFVCTGGYESTNDYELINPDNLYSIFKK